MGLKLLSRQLKWYFIYVRWLHLKLTVSGEGSEQKKKKRSEKRSKKKEGRNFINAFSSCECDNKLKMAYCDIWSDTWSSWESRVSDFRLFLYCYTHVMQCNTVHELVFFMNLLPPKKKCRNILKTSQKEQPCRIDNLKWVFKAKDICFAFN